MCAAQGETRPEGHAITRLRAIFDGAPDALLVADDGRRYLDANRAACSLFGLTRDEIVGRRIDDFAAPGIDVPAAWSAFLEKGQVRGDFELVLPGGRRRTVEFHATARISPGEHLTALRDVTEERRAAEDLLARERAARDLAQETARRLGALAELLQREQRAEAAQEGLRLSQTILAELPDAVLLADLEGRIVRWSGGASRMYGYSAEEAVGAHASFVHPPDVRERIHRDIEQALLAGDTFHGEMPALRKDGTVFPLELRARLLRDSRGRPLWFLGISRDLTSAQEAERQRLQLEVEQSARAQAELRNREKDDFLAVLSHELRNPLSPILTALELLRLRGRADREHRVIERQVGHLVRLVDDLLDVSRIARGKVEMQRSVVELSQVVGQAVEMTAGLFEKRGQELRVEVPREGLRVDGDPTRLSQVVSNLLTNAARYTPPGGHVWVSAERDDRSALLRVRDDGQGLEPELLPRLFERFVQGTRGPGETPTGGLGLGLSIVRALVELHGGTASARSEGRGRGSEFRVELPLVIARDSSAVA